MELSNFSVSLTVKDLDRYKNSNQKLCYETSQGNQLHSWVVMKKVCNYYLSNAIFLCLPWQVHAMENVAKRMRIEFCDLVKEGPLNEIQKALDKGADAKGFDKDGTPLIIVAAAHGRSEVCRLLIAAGASVDVTDEYGKTALVCAAENGRKDVCELLINQEADVEDCDQLEWTALMYAADGGHAAICGLLIDAHASIDAVNIEGRSALFFAAIKGNAEICRFLIENDAQVNLYDNKDETPLCLAADANHTDVCKLLLDAGALVNVECGDERWTPLMGAVNNSNHELCALIAERGANVTAINRNGERPLLMANIHCSRILLKSLLLAPVINGRILSESYERLLLALWTLKMLNFPFYLKFVILCSNSELEKDFLWVLIKAQERGSPLPIDFKNTRLHQLVVANLINVKRRLKKIKKEFNRCSEEKKALLDPQTLGKRMSEVLGIPELH